jgi:hypothetical protein
MVNNARQLSDLVPQRAALAVDEPVAIVHVIAVNVG